MARKTRNVSELKTMRGWQTGRAESQNSARSASNLWGTLNREGERRRRLSPLGPVHREDARSPSNQAPADNHPADGQPALGVVRKRRIAHLLFVFKLARFLAAFLRNGLVNVSGHG